MLRGVLVALAVDQVAGFAWRSAEAVVVLVVAVFASLWVAQHPPRTQVYRYAVVAVDVIAVLVLAGIGWSGNLSQSDYGVETQYVYSCPSELDNLYAYDAAGKPLSEVRLYDQGGTPFDVSSLGCDYSADFAPTGDRNVYPWPSAGSEAAPEQTGPPTSLAPLPGATVSSGATPSASVPPATPPSASVRPTVTPTR